MYVDVRLSLVETWGDQHYIGLTGVQLLGKDGDLIALNMSMIDAQPRDLHQLPGHENDDRTLDKSASVLLFMSVFSQKYTITGIERVQALADISRSCYVVIAMKPMHCKSAQ